ncbi:unnamed protein product, partial [Rotaria magnacalcarata]
LNFNIILSSPNSSFNKLVIQLVCLLNRRQQFSCLYMLIVSLIPLAKS